MEVGGSFRRNDGKRSLRFSRLTTRHPYTTIKTVVPVLIRYLSRTPYATIPNPAKFNKLAPGKKIYSMGGRP